MIFFCLLNYNYNSSTIPIAFIVKFWSESSEVTSSSTMKEESFEDYRDMISNWTPCLSHGFFIAHAHSCFKLLCRSVQVMLNIEVLES